MSAKVSSVKKRRLAAVRAEVNELLKTRDFYLDNRTIDINVLGDYVMDNNKVLNINHVDVDSEGRILEYTLKSDKTEIYVSRIGLFTITTEEPYADISAAIAHVMDVFEKSDCLRDEKVPTKKRRAAT